MRTNHGSQDHLQLDSYYTIGHFHLFCQDYALHGWEPLPHLIVADGCSSAPNSDLGARLLALSARQFLPVFAGAVSESERLAQHWTLGRRIVRRAARQARHLGLDDEVLDTTLLVAWCDGATVFAHLYGDGCLALRRVDGAVETIRVDYAENAPYYLSYLLDAERQDLYREAVAPAERAQKVRYCSTVGERSRQQPFDTPTLFAFDLQEFPIVALATDGLDSLLSTDNGTRLALPSVAQALLDLPVDHAGAFVQRTLYQILFEYAQQQIFNSDDIGLGVFARLDAMDAGAAWSDPLASAWFDQDTPEN